MEEERQARVRGLFSKASKELLPNGYGDSIRLRRENRGSPSPTIIWFPPENHLASSPYEAPPIDPIWAFTNDGDKKEDQSRRDVIWVSHNTP